MISIESQSQQNWLCTDVSSGFCNDIA